ncbi:DNA cytosine methyltransferase [SAR116 cluster bacterium]|nr:DNA cytosine methyltransferase [SAR116 cluster bacterium]
MLKSLELFTGAGGLAIGLNLAGFETQAYVEHDKWCCSTLRNNVSLGDFHQLQAQILEEDVRDLSWLQFDEGIDLIAGGPPCQPFSLGGIHKGSLDSRDMFPHMIDAIAKLRPKSFIVENVKGLTRSSFSNYLQLILLRLRYPTLKNRNNETPLENLQALQIHDASNARLNDDLTYSVFPTLVNAADYGVPQKRERIFIVGFRNDLNINWSFPAPTHSSIALEAAKFVSKDYWQEHRIKPLETSEKIKNRLPMIMKAMEESPLKRWQTVRDGLIGLGEPREANNSPLSHSFQGGAKQYKGHTGSPLDLPAKALKAGVHGVPGGENMMVLDDGSVRYFTIREAARMQTFPDTYRFDGAWSEVMRQLGNAVPVKLGKIVAQSVAGALLEEKYFSQVEKSLKEYPKLATSNE